MKYWLLTTEYPPFHGGGISTYCYFTAKILAGTGHEVSVFVQDDSVTGYQSTLDSIPHSTPAAPEGTTGSIRLIRFNSNLNNLHNTLGYTARLSYAFAHMVQTLVEKEGPPDIIEAQDYFGIAYYLTQFKHLGYPWIAGIPIVITLHSPAFVYLEYNRVPTWRFPDFWTCEMEKQAIKAADLLLSPTHFLVEEIQKYVDISDRPVKVLPNPYQPSKPAAGSSATSPPPHLQPAASGSPIPPPVQRNKIVYYGKLSPQKGSFELLAYFKDLWEEGFPHPLHIIGGTDIVFHPEMQTMGQLVEQRYKKYIDAGLLILHGKIRPSEIDQALADAHVIIVPSIVDNLPYVVMEAMSLGKVVLASIQGGQREMIEEGVSGFLFDHQQPGSFKRQLQQVLDLDDDKIRRIGQNAIRAVSANYDPVKILEEKKKLLEPLLQKTPRSPSPTGHTGTQPSHRFPFVHQEPHSPLPRPAGDLLSIVIPYYNMGPWIDECIQSIRASTYPSIEILLINDGSTDPASLRKLEEIGAGASDGPPIKIIYQKNQGLAHTRNNGARAASGAWLAFLDADDKVFPEYYEKAIRAIRRNENVFFAGSWAQYFESSEALWPTFTPQPPYALVHNPVNSSGLVYHREAFLAGGLNDKTTDYGLEDYESVINMLHHGFNGVVLPEPLFWYRVRKGSMIRRITREKLIYSNKYIVEQHTAYYIKFAPQIINLLNANGPGFQFDNPTFGVQVTTTAEKDSPLMRRLKSVIRKNEQLKKIAITIKNKLKS